MLSNDQVHQLNDLLSLPWAPHVERTEDSGIVMTIPEVPEFVAAADDEQEATEVFWDALRAVLSDYLERGDTAPVPIGAGATQRTSLIRNRRVLWFPSGTQSLTGRLTPQGVSIA